MDKKLSEIMILENLEFIQKNCEKLRVITGKYALSSEKNMPWAWSSLCDETDKLILEFNWLIPHINSFMKEIGFDFELKEIKLISADFEKIKEKNLYPLIDPKLMLVALRCNRVLSIMKNISLITKENKKNYEDLKKEIKEMEKNFPKEVTRDLYEAIEEIEVNKRLGAVLICGRLIVSSLEMLKGDINEKIKKLKEKGLLLKRGCSSDFIIKANKKARDLFTHNLNYFPDPSQTISMLGDTVQIVKIINEYNKLSEKLEN